MARKRPAALNATVDVITEADLEALQDFFDFGATLLTAGALAERFQFELNAQTYKGARYEWRRATLPDPASAEETPDGLQLTATRDVILARSLAIDEVTVNAPEAILESDPEDYIEVHDELADFWRSPVTLYHATTEDHLDDILAEGLIPMCETRGLRNRSVSCAVFTTVDEELAMYGMYGDVVFEINTAAMRRDGYTPEVAQEPDVVEAETLNALAWALGVEDFSAEAENSPYTVIVFGPIPAKYLHRIT